MAHYEPHEYADMYLALGRCDGQYGPAAALYRERFPRRRHPGPNVFRDLDDRSRNTNALVPGANVNGGRPRRIANVRYEESVLELVENNPTVSSRNIVRQLGGSQGIVLRTLHEDGQHPYHYRKVQPLNQLDPRRRMAFCREFIRRVEEDVEFPSLVLWSDESIFTRDGIFNQHNSHHWARENPRVTRQRGYQERFSVNIWAGVISDEVIGPHIFPDRLSAEHYLHFLENDFIDLVAHLPRNTLDRMYYMQDGAGPHYALIVRDYLDREYPGRWIGRGSEFAWPPRSPDLTPCDFFLWGYLKEKVYAGEAPNNIDELCQRIVQACHEIPEAMIARATGSVVNRYRMCIEQNGGHIEQLC